MSNSKKKNDSVYACMYMIPKAVYVSLLENDDSKAKLQTVTIKQLNNVEVRDGEVTIKHADGISTITAGESYNSAAPSSSNASQSQNVNVTTAPGLNTGVTAISSDNYENDNVPASPISSIAMNSPITPIRHVNSLNTVGVHDVSSAMNVDDHLPTNERLLTSEHATSAPTFLPTNERLLVSEYAASAPTFRDVETFAAPIMANVSTMVRPIMSNTGTMTSIPQLISTETSTDLPNTVSTSTNTDVHSIIHSAQPALAGPSAQPVLVGPSVQPALSAPPSQQSVELLYPNPISTVGQFYPSANNWSNQDILSLATQRGLQHIMHNPSNQFLTHTPYAGAVLPTPYSNNGQLTLPEMSNRLALPLADDDSAMNDSSAQPALQTPAAQPSIEMTPAQLAIPTQQPQAAIMYQPMPNLHAITHLPSSTSMVSYESRRPLRPEWNVDVRLGQQVARNRRARQRRISIGRAGAISELINDTPTDDVTLNITGQHPRTQSVNRMPNLAITHTATSLPQQQQQQQKKAIMYTPEKSVVSFSAPPRSSSSPEPQWQSGSFGGPGHSIERKKKLMAETKSPIKPARSVGRIRTLKAIKSAVTTLSSKKTAAIPKKPPPKPKKRVVAKRTHELTEPAVTVALSKPAGPKEKRKKLFKKKKKAVIN